MCPPRVQPGKHLEQRQAGARAGAAPAAGTNPNSDPQLGEAARKGVRVTLALEVQLYKEIHSSRLTHL